MVDDKLRILTAIKKIWGRRVTTVFVLQGHYALDPKTLATYPAADLSLERIGALFNCELRDLVPQAAQLETPATRGRQGRGCGKLSKRALEASMPRPVGTKGKEGPGQNLQLSC